MTKEQKNRTRKGVLHTPNNDQRGRMQYALTLPFVFLIKVYQYAISPWFPKSCRFVPSCSQYGIEAFQKHGVFKGFWLTLKRVLCCHPWGGSGYDPVP